MGDRKVLNYYISPDFDQSIIPRMKKQKDKLVEVRMMLPFSLRCNTCGEYIYRGKKFNSKSEFVQGDDYLGIRKLRFYIKCTNCAAEITFKTDPQNADYECESGASRNFELWRDTKDALEAEQKEREEEEIDPMKNLEHRTLDNKMEMDILDALDEMKAINQRHQKVDKDKVLQAIARKHGADSATAAAEAPSQDISITLEEEEMIRNMFAKKPASSASNGNESTGSVENAADTSSTSIQEPIVIRNSQKLHITKALESQNNGSALKPPMAIISRKRKADSITKESEEALASTKKAAVVAVPPATETTKEEKEVKQESVEALGFLMGYGDDDDE